MPTDPLHLLVIPLVLSLAVIFIAATLYDFILFRRRRKNRNKTVYRCETCRNIYAAPCRTPLARCPGCGSLNAPAIQ